MRWKNFMIWMKKSKIPLTNKSLNYIYYCFKGRKNVKSKNHETIKPKNGRILLSSKCSVCNSKKSKLFKE